MRIRVDIIWVLILVFFGTYLVEAPIRYVLYLAHASPLLYLRDALLLFIFLGLVTMAFVRLRASRTIFSWTVVIVCASMAAIVFSPTMKLWLMGLKILLPVLVGYFSYRYCEKHLWNATPIFAIMAVIAVGGLVADFFLPFPWDNLQYSLGTVGDVGVRNWTMMESILRLNGFSNGPQKVADQVFILGLFLFITRKNPFSRIVIWVLFMSALLLTTVKTVIVGWLIIGLAHLVYTRGAWGRLLVRWSLVIPLVLTMALPLVSLAQEKAIQSSSLNQEMVLGSFFARLNSTWPHAFHLIFDLGSPVFGRGLGTMGGGQTYFELDKFNPGDNLFVYLYGNLGLLGILIIPWIFWRVMRRAPERETSDRYWLYFALFFFLNGITSHGIEDAFLAVFFGFFLSHLSHRRTEPGLENGGFKAAEGTA